MIKKVVVAAAGQGTRMLHLSDNKSKHLICVKHKPFLAYLLDNLILAGYTDIILVVGFKKELMYEFIDDSSDSMVSSARLSQPCGWLLLLLRREVSALTNSESTSP